MTDPFARFQTTILRRLGVPCSAVINGATVNFDGVFHTQFVVKVDGVGNVVTDDLALEILTTVADQLAIDDTITVNGAPRVITNKQARDEGFYTTLNLKK